MTASRDKTLKYYFPWQMRGVFVVLALIFFGLTFLVLRLENSPSKSGDDQTAQENTVAPEVQEEISLSKIDFQSVVDEWADSVSGNKSVVIYDLERDEMVGSYNPDENYNTASLYKLFVVYEGYRRVQNGTWDSSMTVGNTGKTVLECLDKAIRESDSPCAETLWVMIGHNELDRIIMDDFNIYNSSISELISNPGDILKMMQIFYNHDDVTDENLIQRIKDSFLVQPVTTYNWRQGLPSGFSDKVNVYNKVGWEYNPDKKRWDIYHDAAIIEFPEDNRHFVVVVMTNQINYTDIAKLGSMIEQAYYSR